MTSPELDNLTSVSPSDVEQWLREAWDRQKDYPSATRIARLADRINIISERQNSRANVGLPTDDYKSRRAKYMAAQRRGRALLSALDPVLQRLWFDAEQINSAGVNLRIFQNVTEEIKAIESTQRVVESFLHRPPPPNIRDHQHPILWISTAAKEAWMDCLASNKSRNKLTVGFFSVKPESALVGFIQLALVGIGWVTNGAPGASRDTISEHLRGRENRPRKRRLVKPPRVPK